MKYRKDMIFSNSTTFLVDYGILWLTSNWKSIEQTNALFSVHISSYKKPHIYSLYITHKIVNEQNILWFDVNLCVHGYSKIPLGNNDFLLFLCYFHYVVTTMYLKEYGISKVYFWLLKICRLYEIYKALVC